MAGAILRAQCPTLPQTHIANQLNWFNSHPHFADQKTGAKEGVGWSPGPNKKESGGHQPTFIPLAFLTVEVV